MCYVLNKSQFRLSSKASFLHIVIDVYTNDQNIQQLKKNIFLKKLTLKQLEENSVLNII